MGHKGHMPLMKQIKDPPFKYAPGEILMILFLPTLKMESASDENNAGHASAALKKKQIIIKLRLR